MGGLQLPPWEAGILIPNLPNELALVCLARVPRLHHRALSAVSKPIRSAVSSPEFFETRSRLGFSEDVLYLKVRYPFHSMWFTLHRRQDDETLIRVPVPPPPAPQLYGSASVALAGKIYVCGGWMYEPGIEAVSDGTSGVWVHDCRSGAWSPGPAMVARRTFARAAAVGGKIYVVGNCKRGQGPFAEVLGGGGWEALPEPPVVAQFCPQGVVADGCMLRVWVDYTAALSFDTAAWRWAEPVAVPQKDCAVMCGDMAMVDGALYNYETGISGGGLKRFHEETREWKSVLEEAEAAKIVANLSWLRPKLMSVGGKLVVMSDRGSRSSFGFADAFNIPLSLVQKNRSTLLEAWCTEVDISERRVLQSEKVFEILFPPDDLPNRITTFVRMWDWNIFKVSL